MRDARCDVEVGISARIRSWPPMLKEKEGAKHTRPHAFAVSGETRRRHGILAEPRHRRNLRTST